MSQPALSNRTFGLIFAVIFTIFTTIGWYLFDEILRWAIVCSGVFLILALVCPDVLMPLNRLWGLLARRIHRVINFTLLASFFYLLLLPFAVVMRLFGRDAMNRVPKPDHESYWQPVTRHTSNDTLSDMF